MDMLNIKTENTKQLPKSINNSIINRILKHSDINTSVQFRKLGFRSISVNLEVAGNLKESVPLPTFNLADLYDEDIDKWDKSELCDYLSTTKFLINVFQKQDKVKEHSVFIKGFFWSMPEDDIGKCETYWKKCKQQLITGLKFTIKDSNKKTGSKTFVQNNFPKQNDSEIIHIRPHASKAAYSLSKFQNDSRLFDDVKYELGDISKHADKIPNTEDYMSTQSFWLSSKYLINIIKKEL